MHPSFSVFSECCKEKNVSPTKAFRENGFPISLVTNWKTGKTYPKIDKMFKFADYFGIDVRKLYEEEQEDVS